MLDYRMNTFLAVCRCLNYTKAAEYLNITQPNVSQHIKWIEQLYQVRLFHYSQRKLALTPEGEALLKAAEAVSHEEHLLRQQLSELNNPGIRLSFGITRSINEGPMKQQILKLLQEGAPLHLKMSVDNTEHLLQQLKKEELDFAVVEGNFSRDVFDSIVLSKEKFIPVCSKEKRLQHKNLRLEDLREECLIIREEGSGSRRILESILESRNMCCEDFSGIMEIGDIEAIKNLVAGGYGISFLYESAIKQELERGQLQRLPMSDLDVRHNFCLIWLKTVSYQSRFKKIAARLKREYQP